MGRVVSHEFFNFSLSAWIVEFYFCNDRDRASVNIVDAKCLGAVVGRFRSLARFTGY